MCLSIVQEFDPIRYGYAVVIRVGKGRYRSLYGYDQRDPHDKPRFSYNKWHTAVGCTENPTASYSPGFHVFHDYGEAKQFYKNFTEDFDATVVLVEVEVRDPVATGFQNVYGAAPPNWTTPRTNVTAAKVTVARERRILRVLSCV